ncbi:uncharacterized beta-barrel protein YwiB (DUF1934 family) [Aequitasia blattaphilus]|uniref:DUF1934 domain-containing protein n=1 Tax=Aequitasia blattaphilus TaxID=2949332 RepID=A0ABT1E8P0_9FIRM|nr:DUF1934 domain-containing protein [Aequitasia blattaphilus]MCP1100882.1 DUF1934 domain-containing protein [Aequitasia blattaphilus]MCR8613522.1 DUF1934 domain-containing protein [Aequitasia blattaphilus]
MNKDVLLSISGLHFDELDSANEAIEVITPAQYFFKNNKHYIIYEELVEGSKETIRNKIKIEEKKVEIIKGGLMNTRIVFEKDRMNMSHYNTPYGDISIGTMTKQMNYEETEDCINVQILYSLDVNDEWAADCNVWIRIKSVK